MLRERFAIPDPLFGGLLLYATLTTLLPSLVFRTPFDVDPVETAPERYAPAAGGAAATLLAPGASEFHQERVRAAAPPAQDSGPLPEDADRTDRTA